MVAYETFNFEVFCLSLLAYSLFFRLVSFYQMTPALNNPLENIDDHWISIKSAYISNVNEVAGQVQKLGDCEQVQADR